MSDEIAYSELSGGFFCVTKVKSACVEYLKNYEIRRAKKLDDLCDVHMTYKCGPPWKRRVVTRTRKEALSAYASACTFGGVMINIIRSKGDNETIVDNLIHICNHSRHNIFISSTDFKLIEKYYDDSSNNRTN